MPVFKGTYPESMTAAIAAFRAGNAPHILQVFEVGTATMMAAKGAIVPVAKVMADAKEPFDPKAYLPTVPGYYTDLQGQHAVVPVQQLDGDVLHQQGCVQEGGPRPEQGAEDLEGSGRGRREAEGLGPAPARTPPAGRPGCTSRTSAPGTTCRSAPRRTAWRGLDTEFTINSPLHVRHIAMLGDMAKKGLFTYAGRTNQAEAKFSSGECAMLTGSAGAQANIRRRRQVRLVDQLHPVPRRRQGRAAELDHRRRLAVGDGRQEARRVQGRGEVLRLPVASPRCRWTGTPRPATCRSRRRPTS